jgi:hypothetical protein
MLKICGKDYLEDYELKGLPGFDFEDEEDEYDKIKETNDIRKGLIAYINKLSFIFIGKALTEFDKTFYYTSIAEYIKTATDEKCFEILNFLENKRKSEGV